MLRSSCLALLIFAGIAAADVQTGVVRSGGQTIPGATITAECGTDKITTVSDDAGRFEIGGLPSTSCKYTVLMFGFEPAQKDAAASSTPLTLDLKMQNRASIPVAPGAAPVVAAAPATPATTPATTPAATPAPTTTASATPAGPGQMPSLTGRGGQGQQGGRGGQAGGRGGQNGAQAGTRGGFQNLQLNQNGDSVGTDASPTLGGNGDAGGSAASDAFTVNGTVSQGVQAQAGDGFGMGGPGAFGFGPGGPGGDFGGGGGRGGPGGDGGGGGRGGPGGGGPGGGGPGGGGFGGGPGGGGPGGGGFGGGGRGDGGGPGGGGGRGGPGGPGGPGGRGPNGVTAFGNRAGRGRGPQWQASITYSFANSALNARPYSFASANSSGLAIAKASTANNQAGITLGGPIMIPKTKLNLKNSRWNFNLTGMRNRNGVDDISSVPTQAMRGGDFSSLLGTTTIYYPGTNTPFANNMIPSSMISPTATSLLNFFPQPTSTGLRNNYQLIASNPNNTNNFNLQVSDPITTKDRININLSRQSRQSANIQPYDFKDPTNGWGGNLSVSYSKTLQPTLVNAFTVSANRNVTNNLSYFSYGANVASELGIEGVLAAPATYGPPTIGLSNFSSLSDGTPATNHSTQFSLTDAIAKSKGKHNMAFGLTGTQRYTNSLTATNARGQFTFSGINTEDYINGAATTSAANPTGYDLADLLLGLPAAASVNQYLNGNDVFYYRQKNVAAYANDDYRVSTSLTLNIGLRWEFYQPENEKYDHMANLAFATSGTSVSVLVPGGNNPVSGGTVPNGLINPDYRMFEPQIGYAWKPWSKRALVLRGGYGIRYNGQALQQQGNKLAVEPPFVNTVSLASTTTPGLTLLSGLNATPSGTISNAYGVAQNYKPAMAQQWNAIAQYTLGRSYVVQLSYFGTKGTDLDVLLGPNRATPGPSSTAASRVPIQNAVSTIQFDESIGNSIFHSGSAQLTRRFARGLSGSATYVLQKSIDDSSTLGGGVVQIENNILAERALSPGIPHQTFGINFNYQTLAGNQKSDWYLNAIRGWQLFGSYNLTSGSPFTATVAGDPSGTGIVGSARADATGLPVEDGIGYFNPAAFTTVATGTYGTAGRDTIPGIWNFTMSASMQRSFRIGERHRLQMTFGTTNPLNHPSITGISTVIGNPSLLAGTPTQAGAMRSVTANARFTF